MFLKHATKLGFFISFSLNPLLSKEFEIEAEHLKDATSMVERLIMEEKDLSDFELTHIGFDMTDPSIREYNIRKCKEMLEVHKKNRP